ncbi:MAG: hypothetical protein ACI9EF_003296 [Pseudohongiellaceae bacterium]|jgi:hypothetical protein
MPRSVLSRSATALALILGLCAPLSAQFGESPLVAVDYAHDSGVASHAGEGMVVVLSYPVIYEGALSLRLHFDEVQLGGHVFNGTGSLLRITSLRDGGVQTLNAVQLAQWDQKSAYFNGAAVQVDVLAWPNTGNNRVRIASLDVGVPLFATESQCGPTDDRLPSNDARVARLMPSACTAWLISDCAKCFLSAGHCGSNSSVQFNVPFSTSGGGLVFPGPEDQYAIDTSSFQSNNAFGNDWQYFGTFANTTSGLTAFEAQGDAFDLMSPPSTSGNTIRITGHGTDNSPNLTYNQKQQTHVGPFTSSGSPLQYKVDTTGGNSGSPVIWEEGNVAIGVHTNAGCSTTGSGSNQGTSITVGALQNALANPIGVCAAGGFGGPFANLGNSLSQFLYPAPVVTACGSLEPNSSLSLMTEMPNLLNTTSTAFLVLGFNQIDAPFHGGVLVPSPDVILTFPIDTSTSMNDINLDVIWPAGIPSNSTTYVQWWVNYSSPFFSGELASNGISMTTP